jgi:hypothetical protein
MGGKPQAKIKAPISIFPYPTREVNVFNIKALNLSRLSSL